MARGNDESRNPRRRPQRPQTDEEKMAVVKQVFPNAQEVNPSDESTWSPEEQAEAIRMEEEGTAHSLDMADSDNRSAQSDAEKESYGDDYNAYKAHKAGDVGY